MTHPQDLLLDTFRAALASVNPLQILPPHLPDPPAGRTLVVGGGKAAAAMAAAAENHWPADAPLSGLVVTRYGYSLPTRRIEVVEASHPLPDGRGEAAAGRMLELASGLGPDDLLLCLLSGGGSSLLAAPVAGLSLKELRAVTKALLASGAPIRDINTVRKHLTRFSGGQVAAATKAKVCALTLSDVVGDDPSDIASGPCAPDCGTYGDALTVLQRWRVVATAAVQRHLESGMAGELLDTPKPGHALFRRVENRIIGSAREFLAAAADHLASKGIPVSNLGEVEYDALRLAHAHAQSARDHLAKGRPRPHAWLSGGESTVHVANPEGRGGRNSTYLLALGLQLSDVQGLWAIACDSDGIDGSEDNAGALLGPRSLQFLTSHPEQGTRLLTENRAYEFFQAIDALVVTGPTRTNVNDFRLLLLT